MGSFVENVNKLSLNLDTIIEAKNMFDDSVLPILQEVADLDLQDVTNDLQKGNYVHERAECARAGQLRFELHHHESEA